MITPANRFIFSCSFILVLSSAKAWKDTGVAVFTAGAEGHKTYRIPAIIRHPNGTLFAFCEGRVKGSGDFGDINIVCKTSSDQGKTWSALQTIVDYDSLQAGNPAPVMDLTDARYPAGRIFLFYNTGNNHENEVRKGNGLREVWYKTSADGGKTWSEPINITAQVHRPWQKNHPQYQFKDNWRTYANTPGHALQIQYGRYKGRIYVAANHSSGDPMPDASDYQAHGYYTDDHGESFHISQSVNWPGSNEATAAELLNGGLLLNSRNQKGDVKARIVARSSNGGATWNAVGLDDNLPDPVCQGSLLNIGFQQKTAVLAFCNAADTRQRNKLTLRISFDEGLSWAKQFLVDEAPPDYRGDFTAYNDIVPIGKKKIGVLYERDHYRQIVFKIMRWK
jgi:sialidase-1